jgi:hypothetical protein
MAGISSVASESMKHARVLSTMPRLSRLLAVKGPGRYSAER